MTGTEIIKPRPAPAKVLVKPLGTGSRTSAVNAETIMMEVFNLLSPDHLRISVLASFNEESKRDRGRIIEVKKIIMKIKVFSQKGMCIVFFFLNYIKA